jgi:hypothetical protein
MSVINVWFTEFWEDPVTGRRYAPAAPYQIEDPGVQDRVRDLPLDRRAIVEDMTFNAAAVGALAGVTQIGGSFVTARANGGLGADASGFAASSFLRATANGYEARTAAQVRSDIGADNAGNLTAGLLPDARLSANVYRRANILGAVSQSGGVPTGAVIERGSDANGRYVRFADGTQICTVEFDDTANAWTIADGNLFRGGFTTWAFPAQFAATPSISVSAWRNATVVHDATYRSASTNQCLIIPWAAQSVAAGVNKTLTGLAVGRWF